MILYQGKGYLVYIVPIITFVLSAWIGHINNFDYVLIIIGISELIVAYISYREHKGNPYKYLDKHTGKTIFVDHKNTVFWIKAEYWALALALLFIWGGLFNLVKQ